MVRNPKATNGKKWLEDKKSTEVISNGKIGNNIDHR